MKSIEELLESLFKKEQTAPQYRDQPILIPASRMKNYTPPIYREMRKLAKPEFSGSFYNEAKIFRIQGQFMAEHTDDCPYEGEFLRYFPTYQSMNDAQLRGYFTWRTRLREGKLQPTSLSFAFVYVYELLNQIGVPDPLSGFYMLRDFYEAYRKIDRGLERYVRIWLKDYVIYYDLDKQLLESVEKNDIDESVLRLLNADRAEAGELFSSLCELSGYRAEKSAFYKRFPEDMEEVCQRVYQALCAYYEKNRKGSLAEKFFGRFLQTPYPIFNAAVFCPEKPHPDGSYVLSPVCLYHCKNGHWSRESFCRNRGKSKEISILLRGIDVLMREKYAFKNPLKPESMPKYYTDIITACIDAYLSEKRKQEETASAPPPICLDLSILEEIRLKAEKTRDALLVETEAENEDLPAEVLSPAMSPPPSPPEKAAAMEDDGLLSEREILFLRDILEGRDYRSRLRELGLLPSIVTESINEKLFDLFSDTVLTDTGDGVELIEDYREELIQRFGR